MWEELFPSKPTVSGRQGTLKTTHVLEKLSQEFDHVGEDPLHFQSPLIIFRGVEYK